LRTTLWLLMLVAGVLSSGCVRRTISITSEPAGALVWLNGREVGRTPVSVDFLYYGEYDVQLVADGCEPLLTTGRANAPWWDNVPLDFFAEITPGEKHSRIQWHYVMSPRDDDPAGLLERAQELRGKVTAIGDSSPAPEAPASTSMNGAVAPAAP
jgi:hypothetical protein